MATSLYDVTGKYGEALAERDLRIAQMEQAREAKSKAAGQKLGLASMKGSSRFIDFMSPKGLTYDVTDEIGKTLEGGGSIFESQTFSGTPTSGVKGSLYDKLGSGFDLNKVNLTEGAVAEGYEITKGSHKNIFGRDMPTTSLTKGYKPGWTGFDKPETLHRQFDNKFLGKYEPKWAEGKGAGIGKMSGALGAYQAGTGLATVFDPDASGWRKAGGAANVALGTNALLSAVGATQFWNPVGWAALGAGALATGADYFG